MKRLFTFLLGLLCLQMANANGVQIGELYYLLNDQDLTAQVTYDTTKKPIDNNSAYSNFSSKNLTIPQQVDYQNKKYKVTSIGENAFNRCLGLISVSLPDGLTSIGDYAFSYCSGLTSVSLPNSLTSIGEYGFYGNAMTSVSFPNSLTSIGLMAFNSSRLTSVNFNESSPSIGNLAFGLCEDLTEVNISSLEAWYKIKFANRSANPNSYAKNLLVNGKKELYGVVVLPEDWIEVPTAIYSGCDAVSEFILPKNLTSIGNDAFYHCSGMKSISFPDGLTTIGDYAFSGCSTLTSISFPDSLTSIGRGAFQMCSALKELFFPDSINSIGMEAFYDCSSLTSVSFSDSPLTINSLAFYGCDSLTEVNIPSLEAWYKIKFAYHSSNPNYYANNLLIDGKELSGVVILPEDWTEVQYAQFAGCDAVTDFFLPKGITSIEDSAFTNCSALQNFVILNPSLRYTYGAFYGTPENSIDLYVPAASLDNYKNTDWTNFKDIKPIIQASELKLSAAQNIIPKDFSLQITATLTPSDATFDLLKWSSSDPSVASVDALGTVTGIKAGQATITAQTIDGSDIKETYELTVADGLGAFAIDDFEINTNESIDVPVNLNSYTNEKYSALQFDVTLPEGLQFESAVLGEELIGAKFQIKSSVQSSDAIRVIVTPTDNLAGVQFTQNLVYIKVKATNSAVPGVEDIQITNAYLSSVDGSDLVLDDSSASVTFKSTIKTITLTPQTQNIILGRTGTITATVQPVDAANLQLLWSVNDPTVVKINGNGLNATLEALKLGSVTVTAVSPYDETIKGEATVNVVGTLQITGEKSIIKTTETLQLAASFVENDKTPEVTWSSSAPQYASVDSDTGLVTGVAVGNAVITATSKEYAGITATFEVEVQQILLGDANDNGSVTVADVVTIANHIVHNPVANWCFINADVNKSGDITSSDITGTINIIAGEEISAGAAVRRTTQAGFADRLLSENFNPQEGEFFNIGVRLDNVIPYSALQASVVIPEGMTVEGVSAGSQASNHNMIYNITDDGRVEIVLFSFSNEPFNPNDNTLFNLLVSATPDCGNLEIQNIIASDTTAQDYNLTFEGGKNVGITTGLENIGSDEPVVATNGNDLLIFNGAGSEACVYTVSGQLIEKRALTVNTESFSLAKGIYMVTVDGRTYKIIL